MPELEVLLLKVLTWARKWTNLGSIDSPTRGHMTTGGDVERRGMASRGAIAVFAVLALGACWGSGGEAESLPPSTVSALPTASPTSTIDPKALPAVEAYKAFFRAFRNAQRRPFSLDDKIPAAADFTKYSFDPFRTEYRGYIWGLVRDGGEYRGTPPTLNVRVSSVDTAAKPYPTVTLSDCQTGDGDWRYYDAQTGKLQPRKPPKVKPPYRSTVTMILHDKRWGVKSLTLDTSRTCAP